MKKSTEKLFAKALLVAVLMSGAIGVSYAGYDEDDGMEGGSMSMGESSGTRQTHADALVQTMSEEITEIAAMASQQAKFREMGDAESTRIARMYGNWIRDHKAGAPALKKLIVAHGGDPADAKILKAPALGTKMEMLHATHMDHMAAVMTSQMRFKIAKADSDEKVMMLMNKRAGVARKHMRQMGKYHNEENCPMCRDMKM